MAELNRGVFMTTYRNDSRETGKATTFVAESSDQPPQWVVIRTVPDEGIGASEGRHNAFASPVLAAVSERNTAVDNATRLHGQTLMATEGLRMEPPLHQTADVYGSSAQELRQQCELLAAYALYGAVHDPR